MSEGPRRVTAACVQMEHGASLDENLERARRLAGEAAARGADVVLLPEYFFIPRGEFLTPETAPKYASVPDFLREASREHGVVLAGTAPLVEAGRLYNACFLYDSGEAVGVQRKVHPMPMEEANGVAGADGFEVFEARGVPVGVAVCADILYPEAARVLGLLGAEVILCPVMSPHRGGPDEDVTREAREHMFVARAYDSAAYVVKAGGFAQGEARQVVGRSLIAAPWGLAARYGDQWTEELLVAELDLEAIRAHREESIAFHRRAPWAYREIVSVARADTLLSRDG